jgi:3-oxoacyl-[acyl-carrier protein] reductase
MKLLENKIVLVTGGSRGIGESIVSRCVEQGATVVFTYVSESSAAKAESLAEALKIKGGTAKAMRSDAASFSDAEALIDNIVKEFGRLDVVINNAGITRDNLMLRMTEQQWDEVINTNLKSVFNITKHALRPMLKQRNGSIINMSSVVGVFGNAGQANYAASKAGIFGFTKSIAKEYGNRNIRCNAIAPGYIETEMTHVLSEEVKQNFLKNIPLGRMGAGEEVADACVFLASDMSRYISGQTLSICGALNC